MTARLPNVGGDEGNWGTVLNEFLQVSHRNDGELKNTSKVFNVKDYGATGDGVTDDTAAIQAAIDACRNARSSGPINFDDRQNRYAFSTLNFSGLDGVRIQGNRAKLYCYKQTVSTAALDFTGSSNCILEDFGVYGMDPGGNPPLHPPTTGFLFASIANYTNNNAVLTRVGVTGWTTVAALYIYGCTDMSFYDCPFSQYTNSNTVIALYISSTNDASLTSAFQTITAGQQTCGQHCFYNCEFHDQAIRDGSGRSNLLGVLDIRDTYSIDFFGGVISSSGQSAIYFQGDVKCVGLHGIQFYSDNGTAPSSSWIHSNNAHINSLFLSTPHIQVGPPNFIDGSGLIDGLIVQGKINAGGFTGSLVSSGITVT